MAKLEAIILYRPAGFEGSGEFRIARTTDEKALRVVGLAAVAEAKANAALYEGLDETLQEACNAEATRLENILRRMIFSPEESALQ